MRSPVTTSLSVLVFTMLATAWLSPLSARYCAHDPRISLNHLYCGPLYDDYIASELLEDGGDAYQRRRSILLDDSCFGPREDEPYDEYYVRMINTLVMQEREADRLLDLIENKEASIAVLEQQLDDLEQQNADLTAGLSAMKEEERTVASSGALFSRYIVKEGDTLQNISYERYDSYTGWLNIYRFNFHKLPHGPNQIEKGQVLLIPVTTQQMTRLPINPNG